MGFYRFIKTTQERRATGRRCFKWEDDVRIKIRAKRNFANLPNLWDDMTCHWDRSWKSHRKTQFWRLGR